MPEISILQKVKNAMGITVDAYDDELTDLIAAAQADLGSVRVGMAADLTDPLIRRAVITYVRANHGSPEDYDRLMASYRDQKGQLRLCEAYRQTPEAMTE